MRPSLWTRLHEGKVSEILIEHFHPLEEVEVGWGGIGGGGLQVFCESPMPLGLVSGAVALALPEETPDGTQAPINNPINPLAL